jgi:hypothetical protein
VALESMLVEGIICLLLLAVVVLSKSDSNAYERSDDYGVEKR